MLAILLLACGPKVEPAAAEPAMTIDPGAPAPRVEQTDELHGLTIADPYRSLEDEATAQPWIDSERDRYLAYTERLPQRTEIYDRLQALWRYDDQTVPTPCRKGTRQVWRTKKADQDKWVWHLGEKEGDPGRVVLDPNTWEKTEQLASFSLSVDCRYAVVGRAEGGDETPVLRILDLDSLEYLPDTMTGWKQRGVTWKHDNSGFFFLANPEPGELEGDGHFYNQRAWFHTLGTEASEDELVLQSTEDKNLYHYVDVSSDGRWQIRYQSLFNSARAWLVDMEGRRERDRSPRPLIEELEGNVRATVVGERVLIHTDVGAERWRVAVASVEKPGREHWVDLIPEREDTLQGITVADGRIYARYSHDVTTRILQFDLEGNELGEVALPTRGTASVWGRPELDEVRITFESFAHPRTVYRHDPATERLTVIKPSAVPVDPALLETIVVDQVWFTSKDGTLVPMFVVHKGETEFGGPVPLLMTGYGGFNISLRPRFSSTALLWLERGGAFALPSLRGGGEFGKAWHEAGMGERKQTVFDDFLGAAEWLVAEGWTTPAQLAISGGSNGGLLVSAAVTQAPDQFGAVLCQVPLTDMVRYHKFGIADIWTEEYGSPDDPEMLPHLHAYSPYHAVKEGTDYPAILVVGSANDARTHPVHASKFAAHAKHADADGGTKQPIMLDIRSDSGHGGGVGIDVRANQVARAHAFLMHAVGL